MITVLVANQKGGVGKTTLTAHFAVEAARENPAFIADLDPQQNLKGWWSSREADTPGLLEIGRQHDTERPSETIARLVREIEKARGAPGFLFVDTPGFESAELLPLFHAADFIVVPIQPSPNDLRAVPRTVAAVKAANRPFCFAVMRGVARSGILQQTLITLSKHGPIADPVISNRVDYATAMIDGRTIQEIDPAGKGAHEVRRLWNHVLEQINMEKANGKETRSVA